MPRFIPASPPPGAPSSERRVRAGLEALDEQWVIIHGLEWQGDRNGRPDDGEADFVLVHPSHGIVVFEVKGGRIDVGQDGWSSIDRDGARHQIKNPFSQAQESKRALLRYLRNRLGPTPRIPAGHAVAFPDVRKLPPLGPQAPDEICWRMQEVDDASIAIEALVDHWRMSPPIGAELMSAIVEALVPVGTVHPRLSDDIGGINARIEAWTQEQAAVLDAVRDNERLIVFGGAGTGKTVLAIEEAARLARQGVPTLLTCYNRPLADDIRRKTSSTFGCTT